MNWLAAVINRVSNASSVVGKAFCPVCSHDLTSPSVVRSPKATGSAFRLGDFSERQVEYIRAPPPGRSRGLTRPPPSRGLTVCDIADDAHCEGRIDREHFLGVDADLALAGDDRPIDLVVVLPRLELSDIRHFVRLVLNRQVLGPPDDRAGRDAGVNPNGDSETAVDRK